MKLGDTVELGVIGDVEPMGLCGSGLVDAVAELVKVGLLDGSGRFVPDEDAPTVAPALADRLTRIGAERVFVLHGPHPGPTPPTASCSRSATSVSSSSPRRRSPRAGRCCWTSST